MTYETDQDLADYLAEIDFAAESGPLADAVSRRAAAHAQHKENQTMKRTRIALAGFAALAVMMFTAAASPAVRAYAQNIIWQVGNVVFTNDPTLAEQAAAGEVTITDSDNVIIEDGTDTETFVVTPSPSLTLEEARSEYGRAIYHTDELPGSLSAPSYRVLGESVVTSYDANDGFVTLTQTDIIESGLTFNLGVGDAGVEQLDLRGTTALYVNDTSFAASVDPDGNVTPNPINMLTWEEDGYSFMLSSNTLDRDALIALAESLSY